MDGRCVEMCVIRSKRTARAASILAAVLIVRIALTAVADPSDGSASTSMSLVSVTVNGQSVEVAALQGSASNSSDPISAHVSFTAAEAQVGQLDPIRVGEVTASATPASPSDSESNATLPFDIPDAVGGSVTFEGATATVDADSMSAYSAFGHATLNANIGDSFVELTDVSIGNSQQVSTSSAIASEQVEIGSLSLVPLREVLNRVTEISADDLIALAGAIGGSYTDDELAAVESERQEAIGEINAILPLGISPLPADSSVQTILDYAESCSSNPLLSAGGACTIIQTAVSDLRVSVETTLYEAVGELPLISVSALRAGVSSQAFDSTATSTAGLSWESAQVAGIDLYDTLDPDAAMTALIEAVELVEAELEQIPGLEGLEIDVGRLLLEETYKPVGDAHSGSSRLNFLHLELSVPQSDQVPSPLNATINVLAMESAAQHEPAPATAHEDPPDPICPGDPSCPRPSGNNPPVAVDDSATTPQNTPVDIDVLPNDSDPDNDPITVVSFTQPSNGTVDCTSGGTCTYTPDSGFSGTDTFTYTITDGSGATSTATVTITIPSGSSEQPPQNDTEVEGESRTNTNNSLGDNQNGSGAAGTTSLTQSGGGPSDSSTNTPGSNSACSSGCGLASTGSDFKFQVLGLYLIIGGFMVCRFSRKVA